MKRKINLKLTEAQIFIIYIFFEELNNSNRQLSNWITELIFVI